MKEQKELKLLSFHAENHRNIKVVELTPDILGKRLLKIVGEEGSGKSTTLELLQTAIAGTDAIKSKAILDSGYLTEVQLLDGDVKIWLGVKSRELTKGISKGESVIESFLYTKDENGKPSDYISDGISWTAEKYVKEINTNLIFDTKSLFTESPVDHRKLIEKLFAEDLAKLGAAAKVAEILGVKTERDSARSACGSVGAFMEDFEAEGWCEEDLAALVHVDTEALRSEQTALEIERGSMAKTAQAKTDLAKAEALAKRTTELQKIKDSARKVVEKIRVITETKKAEYRKAKAQFDADSQKLVDAEYYADKATNAIGECKFINPEKIGKLCDEINVMYDDYKKSFKQPIRPQEPNVIEINELGVPEIPEVYSSDYDTAVQERSELLASYHTLNDSPLTFTTFSADETSELDTKISNLSAEITKATKNNSVHDRYVKWRSWIELKNQYEGLVDELRRMYAQIETGVDGLKLVPVEESGRVNVWMEYDGSYDSTLFREVYGKSTRLFELSGAQRGVVAVLLQAARLDLKKKALRLVILDAVPMTDLGIRVLSRICEERNIQLVTDQTWNAIPEESLDDHTVVVSNGELLFKGMGEKPKARVDEPKPVAEPKVKKTKKEVAKDE